MVQLQGSDHDGDLPTGFRVLEAVDAAWRDAGALLAAPPRCTNVLAWLDDPFGGILPLSWRLMDEAVSAKFPL